MFCRNPLQMCTVGLGAPVTYFVESEHDAIPLVHVGISLR